MGQLMGGDEVITKSKLQSNLHSFYRKIRPYLNGTGGGGGGAFYYDDLYERPVEADAIDMDSVVTPLPSSEGGYVQNTGFNYKLNEQKINTINNTINTEISIQKEV